MELCSTTTRSISNSPRIPYHFLSNTRLPLQITKISFSSHRLQPRIRATNPDEPYQYGKEDSNTTVAVKDDSPPLEKNVNNTGQSEEAPVIDFLDNFNLKVDFEDTYSVLLYGSGALFALWLAAAVVGAIDSIPLFPKLMEVVGLGYTAWFTARYQLFKKSRDELAMKIEGLKHEIFGSDDD